MRSLLARLWLLVPLLLLVQASGAGASGLPANQQTASYLPDDDPHGLGDPLEDGATVESDDDDDAGPRGKADAGPSAVVNSQSGVGELWAGQTPRRVGAGGEALALRILRLLASPLRGPPQADVGSRHGVPVPSRLGGLGVLA